MYDVFSNQELLGGIIRLCCERGITRINHLILSVSTSSRITGNILREQFKTAGSTLIGEWTNITIEKRCMDKKSVVVQRIDGDVGEG